MSSTLDTLILKIIEFNMTLTEEFIIKARKIHGSKYDYRFRYDFYLPEYNLLIEFQGGQHFKPIEYFGGLKAFKLSKERDIFKKELAKLYGIKLIYFTYKHLRMSEEEFEKFIIMIINKMK